MQKLTNAHRAQIFRALADARAPMRYGEVSSYDPKTFCAKVIIQPEGIETGWLPILTLGNGAGWGIYFGLLPPAQVAVMHFEGDRDNGLVLGTTPNSTDDMPPQVPGGEQWQVHKSGSLLKFTNDGNVAVTSHQDMNFSSGRDITMTAARSVTLQDGNSNSLVMKSSGSELTLNSHTLTQHVHPGVQTGSGNTQKPTS